MQVRLHDAVRERLRAAEPHGGSGDGAAAARGSGASLREDCERLTQALAALHLYRRDQHYVVIDGKVQIVDESTGRVMPDRAWEHGLHQMIEAKEGVAATGERDTLARITYQRFFRRYLRLSGMTGTGDRGGCRDRPRLRRAGAARSAAPTVALARRRRHAATPDAASKWDAVIASVRRHAVRDRRPVLIGTRTVQASEDPVAAARPPPASTTWC